MELIQLTDITDIFPRALDADEEARATKLIEAAAELIEEAFLRRGKDFYALVESDRLLQLTVKRIIREMIIEAVTIGDNVGRQSASSTTGPQSDSITWSQGVGIHWGGVHLLDEWLRDLGLGAGSGNLFSFPAAKRYAEPVAYRGRSAGAEFAERGRC